MGRKRREARPDVTKQRACACARRPQARAAHAGQHRQRGEERAEGRRRRVKGEKSAGSRRPASSLCSFTFISTAARCSATRNVMCLLPASPLPSAQLAGAAVSPAGDNQPTPFNCMLRAASASLNLCAACPATFDCGVLHFHSAASPAAPPALPALSALAHKPSPSANARPPRSLAARAAAHQLGAALPLLGRLLAGMVCVSLASWPCRAPPSVTYGPPLATFPY